MQGRSAGAGSTLAHAEVPSPGAGSTHAMHGPAPSAQPIRSTISGDLHSGDITTDASLTQPGPGTMAAHDPNTSDHRRSPKEPPSVPPSLAEAVTESGGLVFTSASAIARAEQQRDVLPEQIGNAKIVSELGRGSMGRVYLGYDEYLNFAVAVKVMRMDQLANGGDAAARFLQEAQLAIRLIHPNIVRLFNAGEYDDHIYLTYEYVDGGTLEQKVNRLRHQGMEPSLVARIVRDIAAGLGEAHRQGVVHRDVKPANILLTSDGTAKLSDLGLAKQLIGEMELGVTQANMVVGTPAYMAPEQAIIGAAVDGRADLYALGVSMYQMLTGTLPFNATTAVEMLMAHQQAQPKHPCEVDSSVPKPLARICLKLLAKKPEYRYPDATSLVAELDEFLINTDPAALEGAITVSQITSGLHLASRRKNLWAERITFMALGAIAATVLMWILG